VSFVFLSSSFGKCETELLAAPQVLPCLLWSETGSGDPGVMEEELREKGKETRIKQYQFYVELGSRKEKEIFELQCIVWCFATDCKGGRCHGRGIQPNRFRLPCPLPQYWYAALIALISLFTVFATNWRQDHCNSCCRC